MKMKLLLACIALTTIAAALWGLHASSAGTSVTSMTLDGTPMTIYRPQAADAVGPVVVIAHGFAGSQQLMQSFAFALARNGYVAVTFDFPGHGRNSRPLTGSITQANGATQTLVQATRQIVAYARDLGDGRMALLGHSMASDIVIRVAEATPEISATIAVSMFSPAVTATAPRDLLIVVGGWEATLKREALRAIGLATAPAAAQPGVTYGLPSAGTGRRVAISDGTEHNSVLFSRHSLREAVGWLDACFAHRRVVPLLIKGRGPWILMLIGGVVLLGYPLAGLLPRITVPATGAALGWSRLWMPLLLPMLVTPLLLRILPTHFLPVLVGDYLAAHFAMYGVITALCLTRIKRPVPAPAAAKSAPLPIAAAAGVVIIAGFIGIVWPLDQFFTSFLPGPGRGLLILAMLAGTVPYFLADEWLTRGMGAGRGAYAASKAAFLCSLAIAIALDPGRLFFLVIIVPVIVLFFLVYGLFSRWIYRRTGHPFVAGLANAFAFAWAIGVTFPLLAS